jgi:pyruvate dehydrogenase E2 component (dihydrolipoamide acetyltransferase)
MPVEVVMPKFGLTMQEGTIQQWFKTEGEPIAAGQPLFEVETEKVLYEVEAPVNGIIARILYPVEATVACAHVVAVIAVDGEDPAAVAARYVAPPTASAPGPRMEADATPSATRTGSVAATPAARKLAKEHAIDLATVRGTGPGGRITREDIEAAMAAPKGERLHGMRKTIAERMVKSLRESAQLTLVTEVDAMALVERRRRLAAEFAVTYTDLLIEAVARALRAHPRLRVLVDGDLVQPCDDIHIGIAVALEEGLIVPVIRHADRLALAEIAKTARALTEKARAGALSVDEVNGGTFTITNLGMYGIDAFTPIIHPPQIAILGVGRIVEKPAVHEDRIAIRSLMTLSLTFDHRIVDGAPAAAFMRDVAALLARP